MKQLRVHGQPEADPARRASPLQRALAGALEVKHSVRMSLARDGHAPSTLDAVAPDDIVEIELDGGLRLWSRMDDLERDYGLPGSRDAAGANTVDIGSRLALGGHTRGAGDWMIRGLKILGIDIAGKATDFIAEKVEGQLSLGPGLFKCIPDRDGELAAPAPLKGPRPALIFLHGTGSSTQCSFGELWTKGGSRAHELTTLYGDRILALEHRTLSESPIQNARDLVSGLSKILPTGSELHLVSHSRGGLIGELLARANRVGGECFDAVDLRLFKGADRARDAAALRELNQLLRERRYVVSRFVRVACPTRGTTLADGRLDKYLSVILNILETIPGLKESLVFDTFASLLAAVLKKRMSPTDLPGLEAMVPGSPLVRLLNRPDVQTDANLRILGGDVEGSGFWGRLKTFATDLYFREDHDLVVNTPAMFGGAERARTVRYWIDTGGRVNHFNYFANADTASRLLTALRDEEPAEFHEVSRPLGAVTEADYRKRAPLPQPLLFVLPGMMGSQLEVQGRQVWIDRVDLALGRLEWLRAKAAHVRAVSLLGSSYRGLVQHLSASHEVVPFPYDWRRPIEEGADALRSAIDARLDEATRTGQPVRILAHSTGGLVVRAMLATDEGQKTWTRMCEHPGARFVMLGTPNGGSHAIGALLIGRDDLVRQLALLDLTNSDATLLAIIAEYPGVVQLLPRDGTLKLFDPSTWATLHRLDAKRSRGTSRSSVASSKPANPAWTVPSKRLLDATRATWQRLTRTPLDASQIIYVAGTAAQTPCDIIVDRSVNPPRVTVMATASGDGRVPWATGIPSGLSERTYYMNAAHGDLASTEESFAALVDLLEHGRTSKLPKTPPVGRGSSRDAFPLREPALDAFPDETALAAAAMGGRRGRKPRPAQNRVQVRVVHNNLIWAQSPVVVGHYVNDVIVGAEALLDRQLDGRLRELHRLDLYPGAYNRAAVVLNHTGGGAPAQHPGAIVAGLGTVGELTPGGLTGTLTHALITYGAEAIAHERQRRKEGASTSDATELRLGITPLLVGAGAGGVRVADSLQAILRAVRNANGRLAAPATATAGTTAQRPPDLTARITTVNVLELFEDRAIQIVRELQTFSTVAEFRSEFVLEEVLSSGAHGARRATFDELPGWWQRVRISRGADDALKFETLTERARAEAALLPTQHKMVQDLLQQAVRTTATDLDLSATLYELLVPREMKEQAPDQRPLVLVVDETSAMLPWELMYDRWNPGTKPLSVETGMLRQFVSLDFRTRVLRAAGDTALVVGDPPLEGSKDFVQLPGAAAEAEGVAAALRARGFETTALIGEEAYWSTVLSSLFGQGYKVLHIAAHGVHEFEHGGRKVTGVVLGNGAFLTPAEFEQMRVVPDLVFINCCHLGEQGDYGRSADVAFPRLAANVAQQLIRMGVRAVVAAGWAVDDQAAKAFANCFYENMLAGREFGEAVRAARQEIFAGFSSANTWGAYQCYGDPGFSLRQAGSGGGRGSLVAERELEYLVTQLANGVRGGRDRKEDLLKRLQRLLDDAQPSWLTSGSTCAEVARAFAELGRLDEAIKYYDRVLVAEPASATLGSVEQLANMLARLADAQDTPALDVMTRSAELLEYLCKIGKTVERLSLVGSTWKRRAVKSSGEARIRDLERMTAAYEEGYALAVKQGRRNAWYPLGNVIAGKLALGWSSPPASAKKARGSSKKAVVVDVSAELKAMAALVDKLAGTSTDFWELCVPADLLLLQGAARGTLSVKEREALVAAYKGAAERAGTLRELASATGQIAFLRNMARASKVGSLKALASTFDEIIEALR